MAADRAYLAGGRVGPARAALAAATGRLMARFEAAGAERVEPAALLPAEALLDVYGEDLRARAFTVGAEDGRELFLRPDFTMPVLELHLASGGAAGRRCYLGPVWRRQPPGSARPAEHLQAGIELFGEPGPDADAELFALTREALAEIGVEDVEAATGDLGVAVAVLDATPMSERRRSALKRHFWRPARLQALLRRWSAPAPEPSPARRALLEALASDDPEAALEALGAAEGAWVGARAPQDVLARARALAEDAAEPPIPEQSARLLDAALAVEGPADAAHARLSELAKAAGLDLHAALDRMSRRLDALHRAGVEVGRLPFRAGAFRTLEYYDGFVFELRAPGRPDLPPLAGGGRYDGIAEALGASAALPAVGAMIRPEAALAAARGVRADAC
jgi:ATP phosphoribosyltransferase regulatory subunit